MPFSTDLTSIISKFKAIDPSQNSINVHLDPIAKRSCLDNFFGWVIHIISFGLISKNPELDKATGHVLEATKAFFSSNSSASQMSLIELGRTFSVLESINEQNLGSYLTDVRELAQRVQIAISKSKPYEEFSLLELLQTEPSDEVEKELQKRVPQAFQDKDFAQITAAFKHLKNDKANSLRLTDFYLSSSTFPVLQTVEAILQMHGELSCEKIAKILKERVISMRNGFLSVSPLSLFGKGNHCHKPVEVPKILVEGFKIALQEMPKNLHFVFSETDECRVPASMAMPFVASLQNTSSLISIDIQNIGVLSSTKKSKYGFSDNDVPALLNVLVSNPELQDMKINTNAMIFEKAGFEKRLKGLVPN